MLLCSLLGLAAPTIRAYFSGMCQLQIARGFPEPGMGGMPRLKQILRRVAVTKGKEEPTRNTRLPITRNILQRMKKVWLHKEEYDNQMLWAVACVTFFTFSCLGEMTVLERVRFDPKDAPHHRRCLR